MVVERIKAISLSAINKAVLVIWPGFHVIILELRAIIIAIISNEYKRRSHSGVLFPSALECL